MKKIIFGDFTEFNSKSSRLGNYHYCNCFVKDGYEALWISNAFNQLIYLKDKEDYYFKKSISDVKRHQLSPNIYGFAPYSWRLYGNYLFSRSAGILERFERYIIPDIRQSLRKMEFLEVDVLWISNPKMYWLTNMVKYQKFVYRIADDYRHFAEFPNIASVHEKMIAKADQVLITSSILEEPVRRIGKKPLLLSNGVEFEHFNQSGLDCPQEYLASTRKRLVYIGALKNWFDKELIDKLAKQVDADIFIIGKCETDFFEMQKHKNIKFLGARDYKLLPGYLQYADVALIPFVRNPATNGISPIKLYEYCSAGVPVVSTALEETARQKAPIWLADNHDEFIAGVKYYLTHDYDRVELIDFGRNNSWAKRYELIKKTLV